MAVSAIREIKHKARCRDANILLGIGAACRVLYFTYSQS